MPPPNDGPPDLDEILRKLQQKISAILGFRGRGGAPASGGGGSSGAAVGGGVAFVVLLIVAVWLASGFYIVDEGRRGAKGCSRSMWRVPPEAPCVHG
jgi:modulator of FtsH protease HflK